MANGGPHGDKWNKYPHTQSLTDEQFLDLLNTPVEGKYATGAILRPNGTLFVANYGDDEADG